MTKQFKYPDVAALKAAYDSGELDRDQDLLIIDSDTAHVYKGDEQVFAAGGPHDLAAQALDLLDIPYDGA